MPKLKQIVSLPTCNLKTLDVILTNLGQFYSVPIVVPPVPCDDQTKGVPSDHSTPVAHPLSNDYQTKNVYKTRVAQPLPDSGMREFGRWVTAEDWTSVPDDVSPTMQVQKFQELIEEQMKNIFPKKSFKVTNQDKVWIKTR